MYYGKCNYGKNIYGKNIMANETEPLLQHTAPMLFLPKDNKVSSITFQGFTTRHWIGTAGVVFVMMLAAGIQSINTHYALYDHACFL